MHEMMSAVEHQELVAGQARLRDMLTERVETRVDAVLGKSGRCAGAL